MAGTAQRERAAEKMAANNNTGGPSVPSSTEKENETVLEGVNIDWSAPITKAQAHAQIARKGRQVASLVTPVISSHILGAEVLFEGDDDDKKVDGYHFPFVTTNGDLLNIQKQITTAVEAKGLTGVTVSFAKHAQSPNKRSTKAEDRNNKLVYIASVMLSDDSEPATDDDDNEE